MSCARHRRSPRLAVCRGSDNPLADLTGAVLATDSGADNGASSTGYTGTLLALGMLVDRLAGNSFDWAALPAAVATVLSGAQTGRRASGKAAAGQNIRSISSAPVSASPMPARRRC